jgi:predicted SprT family Zn-dependent metalloprotease
MVMKVKKFNEFILENKQEEIDMQKEFDYLNNLMFDNKVKPVKLQWFNSKTKLGLLRHLGSEVVSLSISKFYNINKKQFMETLAHEMIHALMVQNSIFEKDDHGSKFMRILNDLNTKFPQYNIKKTEDASEYTVKSDSKKSIGVVLFNHGGNDNSCVCVTEDIINNETELDNFVDELKAYMKRVPMNVFVKDPSVDISFYKCSNPDLLSFKIKRKLSLSNLQFFSVNAKTLKDIEEGDLIKKVKLK